MTDAGVVKRVCYYVVVVDDTWAVRFDHHVGAEKYVTLIDAIDAARILARTRWENYGLPSCVHIESPDGTVVPDQVFGDE